MIIFSDFDFVLNDYSIPFTEAVKEVFGVEFSNGICSYSPTKSKEDPLLVFAKDVGLSREEVRDAVEIADQDETFYPTPFAKDLIKYYNKEIEKGNEVRIVTARYRRRGILQIMNKIFPDTKIPVFHCDNKFKHLIISDHSIYFEDNAGAANTCAEQNKNTKVVVPKWGWNSNKMNDLSNIFHIEHKDFKRIEKILQNGSSNAFRKSVQK